MTLAKFSHFGNFIKVGTVRHYPIRSSRAQPFFNGLELFHFGNNKAAKAGDRRVFAWSMVTANSSPSKSFRDIFQAVESEV